MVDVIMLSVSMLHVIMLSVFMLDGFMLSVVIKLLLTLFCKLDRFINIINIYGIAMERPSLQNRVSKFTPKKFFLYWPLFCKLV